MSGRVGGSVRTGSQTLDIEGMVGRNVTSGGERLRLRPQSAIEGSLIAAFGNARLEAPVERDLTLAAEVGRLDGRVGGALLYAGNELTIGPEAEISGTSKVYGANEPEVSPSARLASPIEFEQLEPEEKQKSRSAWLSSLLFQWAMAFLFGALLMLLAPQTADGIVAHLPRYFWSMFIGLVSAIALFAVAVIALVTVVGIPVGLTGLVVLILAIYSAQVYVASWLGNEVFGPPVTLSQSLGRMALGLAFIQVAEAIPVLGHLVAVLIALWGVGGLALWIHARSPWSRPSVAAPPPEAARA